jgi:hypothetical protein
MRRISHAASFDIIPSLAIIEPAVNDPCPDDRLSLIDNMDHFLWNILSRRFFLEMGNIHPLVTNWSISQNLLLEFIRRRQNARFSEYVDVFPRCFWGYLRNVHEPHRYIHTALSSLIASSGPIGCLIISRINDADDVMSVTFSSAGQFISQMQTIPISNNPSILSYCWFGTKEYQLCSG